MERVSLDSVLTFLPQTLGRYTFPQEPVMDGEMIDLTADEKPFYFNPYSGELSLTFPKAERNCEGGILAYVPSSFDDVTGLKWFLQGR